METYEQLTYGSAKKRLGMYGRIIRQANLFLFVTFLVITLVGLSYVIDRGTDFAIKSQVYKNCVKFNNCDGFQPIKN